MTTNDSTSDDYTTDGPAVFDELPTPASAAEGEGASADASAGEGASVSEGVSTPADASSRSEGAGASAGEGVPAGASTSEGASAPVSASAGARASASEGAPASVLAAASTPAGLDREPELVGASAGVSGATQPTVPLSAAPSMAPQGGFGSTTYSSGWGPDAAQGAPTAPGAGAPGYSMPAAAAQATVYPPQRRTSLLAVLTLVFGILGFGVVPVVTGHIALSQLKRTGEDGRGLALAGLILGYVTLAGWVLALLAWLGVAGAALLAAFFSAIAH
ncbi:DUF4190 domain-containing protein [Humibacter sp. BT305]|nr:DUF4190 domain-containing protein [Humibacter sp. BT305]